MVRLLAILAVTTSFAFGPGVPDQAAVSNVDRDLYRRMLADIRKDLEKNYYDPAFRGLDLEKVFKDAATAVASATSAAAAMDIITATLIRFDDSHTRFYPPPRATQVAYGWTMAAVGERPLVVSVDPSPERWSCSSTAKAPRRPRSLPASCNCRNAASSSATAPPAPSW